MKCLCALAAVAVLLLPHAAALAQDIEAGAVVFKKCAACHVPDGTTNKVGPHLGNIIGRTAGMVEGFKYSKAMMDAGTAGLVWNETTLAEYLAAPKAMVPGTKMAFAGLKQPGDMQNLIAYLTNISQ
ncbi:MAG: c-type cytochrome [Devosia sp.]